MLCPQSSTSLSQTVSVPLTFHPKFKTIKEAEEYVGGLSKPSKMPSYSFGISAAKCNIGARLRKADGTVCSKCYAHKGRYSGSTVRSAHARRFERLFAPRWVDAFVFLIQEKGIDYFRWHDSGDLQGHAHLRNIVRVAERSPSTRFGFPPKNTALYPGGSRKKAHSQQTLSSGSRPRWWMGNRPVVFPIQVRWLTLAEIQRAPPPRKAASAKTAVRAGTRT